MTFQELQERNKNRFFDQVIVVVDDIFAELAELERVEHVTPGTLEIRNEVSHPGLKSEGQEIAYTEHTAAIAYVNTQLSIVQPVSGETIYKKYLDRFGRGICCVRERIQAEDWENTIAGFEKKGMHIAQTEDRDDFHAVWVDLMDELGILFEIVRDDSVKKEPSHTYPSRLCQVNISTANLQKTIEKVTELLEIGPWEVGCQSDSCVINYGFRVNGKLEAPNFAFLLAILVCGNIEWEVIEPVKGPLVYNDFIATHGIGFHHVLQEYHVADWQNVLADYDKNGVALSCKGQLGPVEWCYMDTSAELGFFKEMRTDAVMDKLPDGYFQYFYPAQED